MVAPFLDNAVWSVLVHPQGHMCRDNCTLILMLCYFDWPLNGSNSTDFRLDFDHPSAILPDQRRYRIAQKVRLTSLMLSIRSNTLIGDLFGYGLYQFHPF
jgi:hypothetical protein